MELAHKIATAVITKLGLKDNYVLTIRRHGTAEAAMPWIEFAFRRMGKPVETHEYCISLPEFHYNCETKEDRTELATYIYKQVAMMIGKMEPK